MIRHIPACALFVLAACVQPSKEAPPSVAAAAPAQIALERVWVAEGLADPESAALSADGAFLYVSNVAGEGEAKDGVGFIARVGVDGRLLQRDFVTGLNAPKGLVRLGDKLFVSDIDVIVRIDAASGRIEQRFPAPGARFLNDVALAPDGRIFATDSDAGRIYALRDGAVSVWIEDPLLAAANGLLPEPDRLFVATMAGRLLAIDYATRAIETRAEGLGDADGVVRVGDDFLISEWPGLLHQVRADGSKTTLLDAKSAQIFQNDILLVGDMLYIPNWRPGTLTAYRVRR
ncbi:MAG: hypothetical protein JNJ73_04180 [Hyphomonadaceae bacterium]|nr:hypothetical protein [Hyphomonadaceae bacterium]